MESRSPGSTSRTRRALPFRPLPALDCWHFICRTQRSISRGLVHPYHFEKLQDKSTKQPQCLGTSVPPGWTAFPRLSHGNCAHCHACISSLSMPHTSSMDSAFPFLSAQSPGTCPGLCLCNPEVWGICSRSPWYKPFPNGRQEQVTRSLYLHHTPTGLMDAALQRSY